MAKLDIRISRTDSDNPDFQALVKLLDADLRIKDGDEHAFYAQYNKIDKIRHALVAYAGTVPVGIGALRGYDAEDYKGAVEIKRMFVQPEFRQKGIAKTILSSLENWAAELDFETYILETGKKQPEAVGLYLNMGYAIIPNYGQYIGMDNSICMHKTVHC